MECSYISNTYLAKEREDMIEFPERRIMVDSDGVFFNFEAQCYDLYGIICERVDDDLMWDTIRADHERFWSTMPLMPDADLLWEFVRPLDPVVLTGCPKCHFEESAALKRDQWANHFNWPHVITCLAKEKAIYMENKGDILIDDTKRNIDRWVEAGGVGILHTDAESTIAQLKTILIEGEAM